MTFRAQSVHGGLSDAALQIPTCKAEVLVVDPKTGEEEPNGVTVTLAASVQWTATGALESQKSQPIRGRAQTSGRGDRIERPGLRQSE